MQSYPWWQIRLKGRKGSEAQTQVPFLDDLLIAYSENDHASQLFKGVSASIKFYVKNNNHSHLIRTSFADIRRLIGPYYSFYIDYHDYCTYALNYQLDNYAGQVVFLNEIRQQKKILTNSVLVDTDLEPYGVLRNTL